MMNRVLATGALKRFLDARSQGAPLKKLRVLQAEAEAEASREATAPHGAVKKREGNVIFLPDRISAQK